MDLLSNDLFWYVLGLGFAIVVNTIGIYLAHENKHNIVKWILLVNIILFSIGMTDFANVLAYIYFIFLFIRHFYKKKKKGQILK